MTQGRHQNDIRVVRSHNQLSDGAGIAQADIFPGLATSKCLVDSVSMGDIATQTGFTRPHVDDIRIRGSDRETSDRRCPLFVKDRTPGECTIGGFPDAAAGRAEVVGGGVSGDAGSCQGTTTTKGPNDAVLHGFEERVFRLLFGWLGFAALRLGLFRRSYIL